MNKRFYSAVGALSIFLYCVLGFVEEAIEKRLLVELAVGSVGAMTYSTADFLLDVSSYKTILLAVAGVCIIIALISAIWEWRKKK
jgi:hypothetical protein